MSDYILREATLSDIPFLTEAVIAAEKSNSDKLSYSTLFNVSEDKARELIMSMFDEEIEGCELSIDSFLIAEYNGFPAATFGAWIEGFDDIEVQPYRIYFWSRCRVVPENQITHHQRFDYRTRTDGASIRIPICR